MSKTKQYEVTQKGYEALGASVLSSMIKKQENVIKEGNKLLRVLTNAYKNVVDKKERM